LQPDLFQNGKLGSLSLEVDDFDNLIKNSKTYNLDFDDAYQLTVCQKFDLSIVTFD
jgi:predicted nucleic acid-binding protein